MNAIKLGELLPWKEYQRTGDYATTMLTEDGFNIIISLSNLTEKEQKAIGNDAFEIYLIPADCIPFIVLKFRDVFKTDLTINISKLNANTYYNWLKSSNKTITMYLLEGSNAQLKCIRYFDYAHFGMLRDICEGQQKYPAEVIDRSINSVCAEYSIEDLMASARCVDIIPAVRFSL